MGVGATEIKRMFPRTKDVDMKHTRDIMGMPVIVGLPSGADPALYERLFGYFHCVDETFSTYKPASEISRINRGEIAPHEWSADMQAIFALA